MPVELDSLKNISEIFYDRYSHYLKEFVMFICHKRKDGKYEIFQEIFCPIIKVMEFDEKNNSIFFQINSCTVEKSKLLFNLDEEKTKEFDPYKSNRKPYCASSHSYFSSHKWRFYSLHKFINNKYYEEIIMPLVQTICIKDIELVKIFEHHFEIFSDNMAIFGARANFYFPYAVSDGLYFVETDNDFSLLKSSLNIIDTSNKKFAEVDVEDIEDQLLNCSCEELNKKYGINSGKDIFYSYWKREADFRRDFDEKFTYGDDDSKDIEFEIFNVGQSNRQIEI